MASLRTSILIQRFNYKKLTQGQKQIYHDSFINSMTRIIQIEKYFDNTYLYLP
jgi:hypothetical protein